MNRYVQRQNDSQNRYDPEQTDNPYLAPVTIALVLVNIAVYLVLEGMGDTTDAWFMYHHGAMFPEAVLENGEWYRLLTSAFIHFGSEHLINNMIMLFLLGAYLENAIGKVRYLILYLTAAAASSLISMYWMIVSDQISVSGGASGAIFGIIGGLLYVIIRDKGRFFGLTLRRFLIMLALSLYYGFTTAGVDNAAHLSGLAIGFVMAVFFYHPKRSISGS